MNGELILGPTAHYFYSQRLKLHYVDWGNADKPLLVLVHGGRDHARNWDWVAMDLRRYFHVIAPDLRGHGDSQWSIGGSYLMADYVLDLAQLLDAIGQFPVILIGHSLGGAISLQYAGTYPDRVTRLVAIEGLGPPPHILRETPAQLRMRHWIGEMQALAFRHPRRYASLDEAVARMRDANPHLAPEQALHLTVHGSYRDEAGTYQWKFDNYIRATSPHLSSMDDAKDLWKHITCPVLLFRGTESWLPDPGTGGQTSGFRDYKLVSVPNAGHWVHHDQLEIFLRVTRDFLGL